MMQFGGGQQVEVSLEEQLTSQFLLDAAHHLATRERGKSNPGLKGSNPGQAGLKPGQVGLNPGQAGSSPDQAGLNPGVSGLKLGQVGLKPAQVGSSPGERLSRDYIRHLRADVEFRLDQGKSLPETSVCRHCCSMFRPGHNCRVRVRPGHRKRRRGGRSRGTEAEPTEEQRVRGSSLMENGGASRKTPLGSEEKRGSAAMVITCGVCGEITRVPFPEGVKRRGGASNMAASESRKGREETSAVGKRRDKLRKLLAKSAASPASSPSLLQRFLN